MNNTRAVENGQYQHTLASAATLTGTSLHTGETVSLTLKPAPPNHGIRFKRTDLPDEPVIEATIANLRDTERATTIGEGNAKVSTVEHCISALYGLGVDNALIEMDANEAPIADGSAQPYVELIDKAGIQKQDELSRLFEIPEKLHVETESGSLITVVPDEKLRISCTQVGKDGRFCQFLSLEMTPQTYREEIARARTFVYYEDVQPLLDKGLIKGGSLENAVVIKGDSIMSKESLRFPDEFVRHKILDIIGDVALLGRHLRGHIIAVKPGHESNAKFTAALNKFYSEMRTMVPPVRIPKGEAVLDVVEVMKILPHRFPFLLVDRVVGFEGDTRCTAVKAVTFNEPFFEGHFPGHPVMPGVLQVEAMAQVASIILLRNPENAGKIGYFMSADKVKFRKPVLPGDTLFITGELTKTRRNMAQAIARCEVGEEVVSEAELMFVLLDR